MDGTYTITCEGREAGKLKVYSEGLKTIFYAETELMHGVVRLAVVSNGRTIPIGVLLPTGKGLSIKKGFSKNSLFDLGIFGIEEAVVIGNETEKALEPGWRSISEPALQFADPDLKAACKDAKGVLMAKTGEITELAFPIKSGAPFDLMPAFCLGRPAKIGDKDYLIFKLKNGNIFA
jgi:hypothetical protein